MSGSYPDYANVITNAYFDQGVANTLLLDTLASYNDFINVKVPEIIEGFNPIVVRSNYVPEVFVYQLTHYITVTNPRMQPPSYLNRAGVTMHMTPDCARTRGFTYASMLVVDIKVKVETRNRLTGEIADISEAELCDIELSTIPVMVRSNSCMLMDPNINIAEMAVECKNDHGGYFIVNGSEKVVICQDRIAENTIMVFKDSKGAAHDYYAEVRSVSTLTCAPPKMTSMIYKSKGDGVIMVTNIHYIRCTTVPLFVLFRAIGIISDSDIVDMITIGLSSELKDKVMQMLIGTIHHPGSIRDQICARHFLKQHLSTTNQPKDIFNSDTHLDAYLSRILVHDFLPHVGEDFRAKGMFLGMMARNLLLTVLGVTPIADRDSYVVKRVETAGALLANLFRQNYGKMIKDSKTYVEKSVKNLAKKSLHEQQICINRFSVRRMFKFKTLDSGIRYALATGTWGSNVANRKARLGVSQLLNRLNYPSLISHFRRVSTPIEKSGKVTKPRQLHCTQYGVICASESPEGATIGLLKNLAMSATITNKTDLTRVTQILEKAGMKLDPVYTDAFCVMVLVNSKPMGFTRDPVKYVTTLRTLKTNGIIHPASSISWCVPEGEIRICSDAGRIVRPLIRIVDGKPAITSELINAVSSGKISWDHLICPAKYPIMRGYSAVVELLDVQEVATTCIARTVQDIISAPHSNYRYLEIHPAMVFGIIAANMSFANHNQSPRVTYCSAMVKQALGIFHTNYMSRYDTAAHVMTYPQRQLVQSRFTDLVKTNSMPYGSNVVVAFAVFTGYNQEDSLILNKSSVERGMFHSEVYKTVYDALDATSPGSVGYETYGSDHLMDSQKTIVGDIKLDSNGLPIKDSFVHTNDVIIGKRMVITAAGGETTYKDTSVRVKHNEEGFVDRVAANDKYFTNENHDGQPFCMVRIRNHREATNGDKHAYCAQKGTNGAMKSHCDMPHTASGLVPDVIANPNALPSRMTMGMLLEMMYGRHCAIVGKTGDSTPFSSGITMGEISRGLKANGRNPLCEEVMYCPTTGRQFKGTVFTGIAYYQKLKHMVADKVHSRGLTGPTMTLTRQSVSGRAKLGATRCGNMETASLTGMGTCGFLKERMMEAADDYVVYVCATCSSAEIKMIHTTSRGICDVCGTHVNIKEIRIPYCAKLLMQELLGIGVASKINV